MTTYNRVTVYGVTADGSAAPLRTDSGGRIETIPTGTVIIAQRTSWLASHVTAGSHWLDGDGTVFKDPQRPVPINVGNYNFLRLSVRGGLTGDPAATLIPYLEVADVPVAGLPVLESIRAGTGETYNAAGTSGFVEVAMGLSEGTSLSTRRRNVRPLYVRIRYDVTGNPTGWTGSIYLMGAN